MALSNADLGVTLPHVLSFDESGHTFVCENMLRLLTPLLGIWQEYLDIRLGGSVLHGRENVWCNLA